jgi:serine/threonine-protein kinase
MEFLKGRDLVAQCKPGALLPLPTVLSIVARVADALDYAHAQSVVHRDIKPANIMYEAASDQVKVTDFGIARITDSSRTKTGMVLGTPSYMSPEQLAGRKIDGRADLYALGVTLYQLCTGQLPFTGESLAQLMYRIANDPAPDVLVVNPALPADVAAVIGRAMAKPVDQRYQRGAALAADLRRCLARLDDGGGA